MNLQNNSTKLDRNLQEVIEKWNATDKSNRQTYGRTIGTFFYRKKSCWQVELLFKRFKQKFAITTIKAGSTSYAEAEVLLWLIIWTMTEQQTFLAECYLRGVPQYTFFFSTAYLL